MGAQFSGTVEHLFVRLGDRVKAGQPIATLKNDVTQQQTTQAKVAVDTARARLAQVSRSPQPSEIDEAVHQVNEAKAQVAQARTDLDLAAKEFERNRQLYQQGLIPKNEFEKAESNRNSLAARLRTARATAIVSVREMRCGRTTVTSLGRRKSPRNTKAIAIVGQVACRHRASCCRINSNDFRV